MHASLPRPAAAGHGFHALKQTPHIDRFAAMQEQVINTYRFTRRNLFRGVMLVAVVPFSFLYLATWESNKYDMVGKKRGEPLLKYPKAVSPAEDAE